MRKPHFSQEKFSMLFLKTVDIEKYLLSKKVNYQQSIHRKSPYLYTIPSCQNTSSFSRKLRTYLRPLISSVGVPGFEPGVTCTQNRHVSRYTTPRHSKQSKTGKGQPLTVVIEFITQKIRTLKDNIFDELYSRNFAVFINFYCYYRKNPIRIF